MKEQVRKYTCGDVGITLWKVKSRSYVSRGRQKIVDGYRACIEHSVWDLKSGRWQRQKIWISAGELDYLLRVLQLTITLHKKVGRWG